MRDDVKELAEKLIGFSAKIITDTITPLEITPLKGDKAEIETGAAVVVFEGILTEETRKALARVAEKYYIAKGVIGRMPSGEEYAAGQRVIELEAEVERLREELKNWDESYYGRAKSIQDELRDTLRNVKGVMGAAELTLEENIILNAQLAAIRKAAEPIVGAIEASTEINTGAEDERVEMGGYKIFKSYFRNFAKVLKEAPCPTK